MKLLSSMATRHLLSDLADLISTASIGSVQVESTGGVDASKRVAAGESFDLVVLAGDAMRQLVSIGRIDERSLAPLVVSHVAIAVASDTEGAAQAKQSPAFSGAAELHSALRAAKGIGYSTGPSGRALTDLIETWGLMPELRDRLVQTPPGIPVARALVDGRVDLAFQQASELIGEPGVEVLGLMPEECAIVTTFTGGVATSSTDPEAARDVLAFMVSPETRAIRTQHGFVV